jgi:uroporphyrinogen III methyltransferase/synthase
MMSRPPFLPLAGSRILVTRRGSQGEDLHELLAALGATVIDAAAVRFVPVDDPSPIDQALAHLADYAWLVLTSANGVNVLVDRLHASGRTGRLVASVRVAAIGPGTARALREAGVEVDARPDGQFRAEGLLQALAPQIRAGDRVLLLRAAEGRSALVEGLRSLGARVEVVTAYRMVREEIDGPGVRRALEEGAIDAVTFASGSAARHLVATVGVESLRARRPRIICLGPVTAEAVVALGLPVDRVAGQATMQALVAATVEELSPRRGSGEGGGR